MTFGLRLRLVREQKGLTQDGLGKGLGTDGKDVGKSVVYGWEKDQHMPRVDQLLLICQRLDCSADYLLFGKEGTRPRVDWPFPKVPLARFMALPEDDRGYVQRRLIQAMEECERDFVALDTHQAVTKSSEIPTDELTAQPYPKGSVPAGGSSLSVVRAVKRPAIKTPALDSEDARLNGDEHERNVDRAVQKPKDPGRS